MAKIREWRCTRRDPYRGDCPGATDPSARQGYYIQVDTEEEALREMKRRFPDDLRGFTVKLWQEWEPKGGEQ